MFRIEGSQEDCLEAQILFERIAHENTLLREYGILCRARNIWQVLSCLCRDNVCEPSDQVWHLRRQTATLHANYMTQQVLMRNQVGRVPLNASIDMLQSLHFFKWMQHVACNLKMKRILWKYKESQSVKKVFEIDFN